MHKQGYVALGVALCAALGLHAFAFFYTLQQPKLTIQHKPIQLSLLPQITPQKQTETETETETKTKTDIPKTKKQNNKKHIQQISENNKSDTQAKVGDNQQRHTKIEQPNNTITQLIPKKIQQTILTKITYPKQALRRGWEGKASFALEIHQHMIQHVTLVASTGYDILDRAAERGITSIHSPLPLHDGKHLLPVTFRIR